MKRIVSIVLLLALLLCGCGGDGNGVEYNIGPSKLFGAGEIRAAMDAVVAAYEKEDAAFDLLLLSYEDEEFFSRIAETEAKNYGADEAIVLRSTIHTHEDFVGSLDPDQTYRDFRWTLTRNGDGPWELRSAGFA